MSEVALAVAETQAAEQRDKQIQKKDRNIVGKEDKTDELEIEEGNKRKQENVMDKNNDSEKEIKHRW